MLLFVMSFLHSFVQPMHIECLLCAGDMVLAGNIEEKEFLN